MVFIEAGGHGVYGSTGSHSRYSLKENKFSPGTGGVTYVYKRKAERPAHPNQKLVGYELLPIHEHWWKKSQEAKWSKGMMFDAYYEYRPEGDRPAAAYVAI